MHRYDAGLFLMVLSAVSLPAGAQATGATRPDRIGVEVGVNLATVSGGPDLRPGESTVNRKGVMAGAYLAHQMGENADVQVEVSYTQKGFGDKDSQGETAELHLGFLEIPVLLRYNIPMSRTAGVHPMLLVGPALAFRTGCSLEAKGSGLTVNESCGDADNLQTYDIGATIGAGLALPVRGYAITVGARYTMGFVDLSKNGNSGTGKASYNRVFSLVGALELPMKK